MSVVVCSVCVVCAWCVCGVFVVCSWCVCGVFVVCSWCVCGEGCLWPEVSQIGTDYCSHVACQSRLKTLALIRLSGHS